MSEDADLTFIREQLRKAADIQDPKKMWYVVRDILGLLTIIVVGPEPTHG